MDQSFYINTIEFVTIATTGDSEDFGDYQLQARMNASANGVVVHELCLVEVIHLHPSY